VAPKTCLIPLIATSAERNIKLLIDHQCPQCGAPAVLTDTDRLFTCEYCKVNSYLQQVGFFRYVLPHRAPADTNLVYLPYWRFKGMLFASMIDGIHHKFTDISYPAISSRHFPASIGLRSQALRLRFISPDMQGKFFHPQTPIEKILETVENGFTKSLPRPALYQSHIGESLSIIYSPFYIRDRVYDAILNKPVSPVLSEDGLADSIPGGQPDWGIRFLPTLCPSCGWDLEGRRDSLILICRNCDSVWQPERNKFRSIHFRHLTAKDGNAVFLPFWRIKAEISGIRLKSYADMVRIGNLPRVIQDGWENVEFCFWALAFKVRPEVFVRLNRNITLTQPQAPLIEGVPDGRIYPVNLPVNEAAESLKIILASFMKPPGTLLPRLPRIEIRPKSFLLVFIPFQDKHHELVHHNYRMAVNKNLLAMAKNL